MTKLARERLEEKLATEFDCTPCPACWHYQPDMAEKLRKNEVKRSEKQVTRGAVAVLVSFLLLLGCTPGMFFPSSKVTAVDRVIVLTLFGVLLTSVIGSMAYTILVTVRKVRVTTSFDPNRDIPEGLRRHEARRYAVPVRDAGAATPMQPLPNAGDQIEILD